MRGPFPDRARPETRRGSAAWGFGSGDRARAGAAVRWGRDHGYDDRERGGSLVPDAHTRDRGQEAQSSSGHYRSLSGVSAASTGGTRLPEERALGHERFGGV